MPWTLRPTIAPGAYPRGEQMENTLDQIESLTAPGWTSYSSSLTVTGSTSNPTVGNATITSAYRRSTDSDVVVFCGQIIVGTDWAGAPGSGQYRISLPVTAHADAVLNSVGNGYLLDLGTANLHPAVTLFSTTNLEFYLNNSLAALGSAGPGTAWANGDKIRWTIVYQAA